MHKALIIGLFVALPFVQGCGMSTSAVAPKVELVYQLPPTHQATGTVRFQRAGGGNLDFSITRSADLFTVHVTQNMLRDTNIAFAVSRSEVDAELASLIESLYQGTVDIGGTIYRDPRLLAGTWEYAYIDNKGTWLRIANESVVKRLGALESLVRGRLDQIAPGATPSDSPGHEPSRGSD
jgi:hypothetical protein